MTGPSEYVLEPMPGRRGLHALTAVGSTATHRLSSPLAPISEQPSPQVLRRLEHEYSLAAELDPAWAAKPLALTSSRRADDPHTQGTPGVSRWIWSLSENKDVPSL